MIRPLGFVLLAVLAGSVRADAPLWINSEVAKPWLPAITAAAERTSLAPTLIAELIGTESGFQNVKNGHSSAFGCGQQIVGNDVMRRYRLDRTKCDQSIMGAALELREKWDHTGSLDRALLAYGTTSGLTAARRRRILGRMYVAAGSDAYQLPGKAVRLPAMLALQPPQQRQSVVIAGDLEGHRTAGAGRRQ